MHNLTHSLFAALTDRLNHRFLAEAWQWRMAAYRDRPRAFANDVLGSRWWFRQEEIARQLVQHRRVAVKSANGVGKTYLAADLALWFLFTHQPSVVITTAPTWRQVRFVLWEEVRRRFRAARVRLPGALWQTRVTAADGWFALGLATDDPVRFQGFHAKDLLIIMDEASGIPDAIWDAAEGVAVGENNRILAIGNPLATTGRFYQVFARHSAWRKLTVSALEHPNVVGKGPPIPGAVTRAALEDRIADWCEPIERPPMTPDALRMTPDGSDASRMTHDFPPHLTDDFCYNGRWYRPNNLFRARVLGRFPTADDESLIPLTWIEAAVERHPALLDRFRRAPFGPRRLAVDVARFGDDSTVIGLRAGPALLKMTVIHGADTMEVSGNVMRLARDFGPEAVLVDSIGLGSGVVDRLAELELEGIQGVNVSLPALDSERFANRRAEIYWGLRERFRTGDIALPPDDRMVEELAAVRYRITSRGQIQMEGKDEMKKRLRNSPDRADMLALLFDGGGDGRPGWLFHELGIPPSPARRLRQEMAGW